MSAYLASLRGALVCCADCGALSECYVHPEARRGEVLNVSACEQCDSRRAIVALLAPRTTL